MKDILIHYGVKGMKWGVRKQYEATGGGGGGGWGPNNPMMGSPLAAAAASIPNDPKGKKKVGKNAVKNMGVEDKQTAEKEEARKKGEKDAKAYAKSVAELGSLGNALNVMVDAGVDPPEDLVNKYEKALQNYIDTTSEVYSNDYLLVDFDVVEKRGKSYVSAALYNDKFDDWYEALEEMPAIQVAEKK